MCLQSGWTVFSLDATANKPRFHFTAPPTRDEVQHVTVIAARVGRMLRRKGLVHEPSHDSNETPTVDDALEACRNVGHGRGGFERIDQVCFPIGTNPCAEHRVVIDNHDRFVRRDWP